MREFNEANEFKYPKLPYTPVVQLIKENLEEVGSRYLMIRATREVAMYLLDSGIIASSYYKKLIIGSSFESDQTIKESISRQTSEVIQSLDSDRILVFMDVGSIYSLLYDLFNQNFTEEGKGNYCKISFEAYYEARSCYVNKNFKCIVFVEDEEFIIDSDDPHFHNRFEKHCVNLDQILSDSNKEIVKELDEWVKSLVTLSDGEGEIDPSVVFPIYSKETSPYLLLRHAAKSADDILDSCKRTLLKVSSVDLLFLLDIIDISTRDKAKIKWQWEDTHRETFMQMLCRPTQQTIKLIAFTYDSFLVQTLIESINDIHFRILSNFHSAKNLKCDINRFYFSNDSTYIIEVDYNKDAKHLMLLRTEINSIISNNRGLQKKKKFVLLVRMHRYDKYRTPFSFDLEWEMNMYEDLNNNTAELSVFQDKTIASMISEEILYNFRKNISELTENALLTFKYESLQTNFKPDEYKNKILKAIVDNEGIVEDFMIKTVNIVRLKSGSLDYKSWRILIFTQQEIKAEALSLYNALELIVKIELQQSYSLLLFVLEKEYSMYPYINSYLNYPQLRVPTEKHFNRINIEGKLIKQGNNNDILSYIHDLSVPFIYDAFQKLNEFYLECLEEKTEASNLKTKMIEFIREKDLMDLEELMKDDDMQKIIMQDFIRVILNENSQETNYIDIRYQAIKKLVLCRDNFDVLLEVIMNQKTIIEMSNVFEILFKLNSNNTSNLERLQEDISREQISDQLESKIEKLIDFSICTINPSALQLHEVSQYLSFFENMLIILRRFIKTHKLNTKKLFILKFWIEFSRIHPISAYLKQISDKINTYKDEDFICQQDFLKYLDNIIEKSPLKTTKFRAFILHQLISRDPKHISTLFREINEKTNDFWKVSSKSMDLIIKKSCLLDVYNRILYENSSGLFSEYDLNEYLNQIELVMPDNNQFESQFCVLLSDRTYRALKDIKINQMISAGANEKCILDDSIKAPLEFFIKYYYSPASIYPNLTKLICSSKICEYLELYADYLYRTEKYNDEANLLGVFEKLFESTKDGKSFGNYCLKRIKDLCENSYEILQTLANKRKYSSRLMKEVSDEKYTEFIYEYFPFLEYADNEAIEQLLISARYSDFASYVQRLKEEQLEHKKIKILSIVVCFLSHLYTSHLGTNLECLIAEYKARFKDNQSTISGALDKTNFHLLNCLLYNFEVNNEWRYLSLVSGVHENNKRNIILCFMISIMSVYKETDSFLTTPFNSIQKESYSLRELIASRLSSCNENSRILTDLKIEIRMIGRDEQYYRCSKNCFSFVRIFSSDRTCRLCGGVPNKDTFYSGRMIIEFIECKITKLIKKKLEKLGSNPIECYLQIPMENPLSFYLKELLILPYAYFLSLIGNIIPENGNYDPMKILQSAIDTCFFRIKETINCKNYYTFMLLFLSKVARILQKKRKLAQFDEKFEKIISKTSHAELSNTYKQSCSNFYSKHSKSIFLDLKELPTYTNIVNPIRIKQEISVKHFITVYSSQVDRAKYEYLEFFLRNQDKINTLQAICSILNFTNSLLRDFSFQISRAYARERTLASFLVANKILTDKFEKFTEAWKKLSTIKLSFEGKPLPYCELTEYLTLDYFLVDNSPDGNGRYIAAALIYLGSLNNEILKAMKDFTSEKMINHNPVKVQKLKSNTIIKFDFDIYQVIGNTSVINPNYGMGDEVLYDFERIEYKLKKSLQRGQLVDTENLSCIQYTDELLNSQRKYQEVINEIRRTVPQTGMALQTLSIVTQLLESITVKMELHNSMNKLLIVIKERKVYKLDSLEDLCKTIKFKLHPVFTQKSTGIQNAVASLPISNILHLHEIIEEFAFPDLLDTINKKYTSCITIEVKIEIEKTLNTVEKLSGIYPTAREIKKSVMKFIIRCLMEDLDVEKKIITYLANPGFWNYTEEQMKKVERLKNDFNDVFQVLKLSESTEFYKTVNSHLASRNSIPPQT